MISIYHSSCIYPLQTHQTQVSTIKHRWSHVMYGLTLIFSFQIYFILSVFSSTLPMLYLILFQLIVTLGETPGLLYTSYADRSGRYRPNSSGSPECGINGTENIYTCSSNTLGVREDDDSSHGMTDRKVGPVSTTSSTTMEGARKRFPVWTLEVRNTN